MKKIIQFTVGKSDNYYFASCIDLAIVSQWKTLDELMLNIKEASDLFFEDEDFSKFWFEQNPSIFVNFELPINNHTYAKA